ncbi:MAG: hypothetical protein NTW86_30245, partial [Candidatus Sumerlaeota bacterium]|nr:hypothetical protein [Candidatus Sumerlaeota bacterium]
RPRALSIAEFHEMDDAELVSSIRRWARHDDPVLSDLARRLLDRRLFKSIDVSHIEDPLDGRLQRGRKVIEEAGLDPNHYFLRVESSDTPYRPYDPQQGRGGGPIYIEDASGVLRDVEDLSPTIRAFSLGAYTLTRIVFPEEAGGVNLRERMAAIFR